jgi:hypothetical protein
MFRIWVDDERLKKQPLVRITDLDKKYAALGALNPTLRTTLYSSGIDMSQSHV